MPRDDSSGDGLQWLLILLIPPVTPAVAAANYMYQDPIAMGLAVPVFLAIFGVLWAVALEHTTRVGEISRG